MSPHDENWSVDGTSRPGILKLTLRGNIGPEVMKQFVVAHNDTIDAFRGRIYQVFVDLRELLPLSAATATILEEAKRYSSSQKNFRGSAVWVSSATVALQHRRTSVSGGVMDTELISDDEEACWRHLADIRQKPRAK